MSAIEKLNIEQKLPIIRTLIENTDPEIKPNINYIQYRKVSIYHI